MNNITYGHLSMDYYKQVLNRYVISMIASQIFMAELAHDFLFQISADCVLENVAQYSDSCLICI